MTAVSVARAQGFRFALERGDLVEDKVHIRRNLDGTGQLKLPKNGKQRVVILPPPARDARSTYHRASTRAGCS